MISPASRILLNHTPPEFDRMWSARLVWRTTMHRGQVPPAGSWRGWMVQAGRGFGKALALDTPLPTPKGWTTMGEVEPGDWLYDEAGVPTRVLGVFDVPAPEDAYRVCFSDGTEIRACGSHQWVVFTHIDRKRANRRGLNPSRPGWSDAPPVDTRWLKDNLCYGERRDRNLSIPQCQPLTAPRLRLDIDPYLLGYWLGDGTSTGAALTVGDEDHEWVMAEMSRRGQPAHSRRGRTAWQVGLSTGIGLPPYHPDRPKTLFARLRRAGLLSNKHVPSVYMRASVSQRIELLRGLMDSDGSIARGRYVEFSSTNYRLAEAVTELARSLGERPTMKKGHATLYGVVLGPRWRVTWRPNINPFSLPRKAESFTPPRAQASRSGHRMVSAVIEIPPEPMRCITVDSPSSLFLASEAMIPTHNTLTGSIDCAEHVLDHPGYRYGIVAPTLGDARDTALEGETGLIAVLTVGNAQIPGLGLSEGRDFTYNRSRLEVEFHNSSHVKAFGTESPDRLRGPQHHRLWFEELASVKDAWKGDALQTSFNNAMLGLRLKGKGPTQYLVTTTPRPVKLITELAERSNVVVTRGTTYDNLGNLAPDFAAEILRYEGTHLGLQELMGEIVTEMPGALWKYAWINPYRLDELPDLVRVVVGVDPSGGSDLIGIVAAGRVRSPCPCGTEAKAQGPHYAVFRDDSLAGSPEAWGRRVVDTYHLTEADRVVAERNFGGDMVGSTIRVADRTVPVKMITASRGKAQRAEPISAMYERGRVHHVGGLAELEAELTSWVPGDSNWSPDRLDACVWALTELDETGPRRSRGANPSARLPDRVG